MLRQPPGAEEGYALTSQGSGIEIAKSASNRLRNFFALSA
jgi:hypothetical protein